MNNTNKIFFKRIINFKYNNKTFSMFKSNNNKKAFLELKNGQYYYPDINDVNDLIKIFHLVNHHDYLELNKMYSFIPKAKVGLSLLLISSSILTGCARDSASYDDHLAEYAEEYDFGDVDYILENEHYKYNASSGRITVYDHNYFEAYLGLDKVSIDDIQDVLNKNHSIDKEYKEFIIDYLTKMQECYPNLDMRIFYINCKDLKVEKNNSMNSMTSGTVAYYDLNENTITISPDFDLNDEYSKLVLRHELGHVMNHLDDYSAYGYDISYYYGNNDEEYYTDEAINCLWTVEPFKTEYSDEMLENIGYPMQVDYYRLILESLPNYSLQDVSNTDIHTLEAAMDVYMGDVMSGSDFVEMVNIEVNNLKLAEQGVEVDESVYYETINYVITLYIRNNITEDMSYDEIITEREHVKDVLQRGVNLSQKYLDYIDTLFNDYINEYNISSLTK